MCVCVVVGVVVGGGDVYTSTSAEEKYITYEIFCTHRPEDDKDLLVLLFCAACVTCASTKI
jgi:hypothetical protein